MKITLETTIENEYSRKVIMQSPYDDQDMDNMFNDFIRPLLLAWGYQQETVDNYFNNEK